MLAQGCGGWRGATLGKMPQKIPSLSPGERVKGEGFVGLRKHITPSPPPGGEGWGEEALLSISCSVHTRRHSNKVPAYRTLP